MSRVVIARQAQTDLEEIARYLAEQNPEAAVRVIDAFHATFRSLSQLPMSGRSLDYLRSNLRIQVARRPADQYAIFYYPIDQGVEIAAVIHGYRDWKGLFERGER